MINKIEAYLQPDGWYKYDGTDYEKASDLVTSWLNFCGCGMPNLALQYVLDSLKLLENWSEKKDAHEKWLEYFGSDKAMYFMWYYLDKLELTEHGSSVPGWLTEKGKTMIYNIEYVLNNETEEEE